MKKCIITMVAALLVCSAANSQEVMKVELKNGQVSTFAVEDINRFYFKENQQHIAEYCEVSILREQVFPFGFAVKFNYDSDVEYLMCQAYTVSALTGISDEQLAADLVSRYRMEKDDKVIAVYGGIEEGREYIFAYTAFNASGNHGPVYRHPIRISVESEEQIADIVDVKHSNDETMFKYRTVIDDDEVLYYYVYQEVGNYLEPIQSPAEFALAWREIIDEEIHTEKYFYGEEIFVERPNKEKRLLVCTWCVDYKERFYNNIRSILSDVDGFSEQQKAPAQGNRILKSADFEKLKQKIKKNIRKVKAIK